MRVSVSRLEEEHLGDAATLVAHEQERTARAHPGVSERYLDPQYCRARLMELTETHTARLAIAGERVVGILHAARDGASANLPASGCAIAPDLDPDQTTQVFGELYAAVASTLVERGALRHLLEHVAAPPLAQAAASMTFAHSGSWAARRLRLPSSPSTPPRASVENDSTLSVRIGTADDLDTISRLALIEVAQRSLPPVYAPPGDQTPTRMRHDRAKGLARGQVHLLARRDGRDIGLLCIERAPEHQRLLRHDQLYLGPAAVLPHARGNGVGRALLNAAVDWGIERDFEWIGLAFAESNLLARPFWLRSGFTVTGHVRIRGIHPAYENAELRTPADDA